MPILTKPAPPWHYYRCRACGRDCRSHKTEEVCMWCDSEQFSEISRETYEARRLAYDWPITP
jgi:rubrerythrin